MTGTFGRKPLQEPEAEDLGRYSFKAMTTVSDVHDFRHFLPRIKELLALGGLDYEVDVEVG